MSKYRVEFVASRIQVACYIVAVLILALSIGLWQPDIMPYQLWLQCLGLLGLVGYAWWYWRHLITKPQNFAAMVSYQGEWTYLDQRVVANWTLGPKSKMTSWLLWVNLQPKLSGKPCWQWVFRDQVSEQDYRRLCRCILCVRQATR